MKENDWILDGIVNPSSSLDDFVIAGYNTNNTLLLSKDIYKKNKIVQDAFTENGTFNDVKFDEYYKQKATEYNNLQDLDGVDTFQYDPFDVHAPKNGFYKSPEFNLIRVLNPTRDVQTLTGAVYSSGLSEREIALDNPIYDMAKLAYTGLSMNDKALFKNPLEWIKDIFSDSKVYAKYDSDGYHIDQITGEKVKHVKGETKLNQWGQPYTETLNGRSLIGKEVVSGFDTLTVDGEGIDKYNFLDSDGIDKNIFGTIMKASMAIAPMFIPLVKAVYSGLMVARELAKTLPMLYGVVTPWLGVNDNNSILNTIASVGDRMTTSMSDAGNNSLLNTEQLANLVTDVALQWGQLKVIALGIMKLKGTDKLVNNAQAKAYMLYTLSRGAAEGLLEAGKITLAYFNRTFGEAAKWGESVYGKAALGTAMKGVDDIISKSNRLGADMSLWYMALVSNTDVYDSMKEAGASGKEAAAVTLGATFGMFGVDKYLHLGEVFFDDLTAGSTRMIRGALKNAVKELIPELKSTLKEPMSKNKIKKLIKQGMDISRKGINTYMDDLKYHSTGFFGKALGEGIEECAEELVTDCSKGLYELAGYLGAPTSAKDVGAFDNMAARYGMSFLGGFLGGGLFYGVDVYNNGKFQIDRSLDDYIYVIRNNKKEEALKILEDSYKKGKLASTDLSIDTETDSDGNKVYISADENHMSQNEYVYRKIKDIILQLDGIMGEVDGKKSDDELFDLMFLHEARFQDLKDVLKDLSYITGYQQEYLNLLNLAANIKGTYDRASKTRTGLNYENEEEYKANLMTDLQKRNLTEEEKKTRDANLSKIQKDLDEVKDKIAKYNSGEYSLEYIDKMLFMTDQSVNQNFVSLNYEQWLKKNHSGKTPDLLTESEKLQYKKDYLNYKKAKQKEDLDIAFKAYKAIAKRVDKPLLEAASRIYNFDYAGFLNDVSELQLLQYNTDSVLDFNGETEESDSYKNRHMDSVENTLRNKSIEDKNKENIDTFIESLEKIIDKYGGHIPPLIARLLKLGLAVRRKDISENILDDYTAEFYYLEPTDLGVEYFKKASKWISDYNDGKSINDIRKNIKDSFYQRAKDAIDEIRSYADDFEIGLVLPDYGGYRNIDAQRIANQIDALEQNRIEALKNKRSLYIDQLEYIINKYGTDELKNEYKEIKEDASSKYPNTDRINAFISELSNSENELVKIITENIQKDYDISTTEEEKRNILEQKAKFDKAIIELGKLDYKAEYLAILKDANGELDRLLKTDPYNLFTQSEDGSKPQYDLGYEYNEINDMINSFITKTLEDSNLRLIDLIDKRVKPASQLQDVVKNVYSEIYGKSPDVESFLQNLNDLLNAVDTQEEFNISLIDQLHLLEIQNIIDLVLYYILAASKVPNPYSPEGHNSTINELADKHKDIFKDFNKLLTLNPQTALAFLDELLLYKTLIGIADEKTGKYNPGSYLYINQQNSVNKAMQHKKTDKALNLAIAGLFKQRDAFRFKFNDKDYDLLEGIDSIPEINNTTEDVYIPLSKLMKILYDNVQKLRSQGWTWQDIIERSGFVEKLTDFNKDPKPIRILDTTLIDEHITYDRLTKYDKLVMVMTLMSLDPDKYNVYLQLRIEEEKNKVPLTAQEWLSRVGISVQLNPELFNACAEYLKPKLGNRAILNNSVFINANQGAGKTDVCAKNIVKYFNTDKVWLSSPSLVLTDNLYKSIGVGIRMANHDKLVYGSTESRSLIDRIISSNKKDLYTSMMSYISGKSKTMPDIMSFVKTDENGEVFTIDFDKLGISKDKDAPKMILIDEVTHLSQLELQCVAYYCTLNDVKLVLMGDTKQNGFTDMGLNINNEVIFCWRTPDLNISLRDNNILHQTNLRYLEDIARSLFKIHVSDKEAANTIKDANINLHNTNLKYCVSEGKLYGDRIVKQLSDDTIRTLSGKIGFIGDKNSEEFKKLEAAGLDVLAFLPTEVQGQEFDYAVVQKNFKIDDPKHAYDVLFAVADLYTMVSRGRYGVIFIDPDSTLLSLIGKSVEEYTTAQAPSILQYATEFQEDKLRVLKLLNDHHSDTASSLTEDKSTLGKTNTGTEKPASSTLLGSTSNTEIKVESNRDDDNSIIPIKLEDFKSKIEDLRDNYYVLYIELDSPQDNINTADISVNKVSVLSDKTIDNYSSSAKDTNLVVILIPKNSINAPSIKSGKNIINTFRKEHPEEFEGDLLKNKYIYTIIPITALVLLDDIIPIPPVQKPERPDNIFLVVEIAVPELSHDLSDGSTKALCYGKASFTGMAVVEQNGKLEWVIPSDNHSKRDIQIFLPDGLNSITADSRDSSTNLPLLTYYSILVKDFKDSLLYNKEYDDLRKEIKGVISEDEYNSIKYRVTRRKRNSLDNFIRNIGLDEAKMSFEKDGYIYPVEAVFTNSRGEQCILTIGLLGDPLKGNEFEKKLVERLLSMTGDEVSMPVDIHSNGITDIHRTGRYRRVLKIVQAQIKSLQEYKQHLEESLNNPKLNTYRKNKISSTLERVLKKIDELRQISELSFSSLNPYTVMSDMYVYAPSKGIDLGVNEKNIGRWPVIFVSNDTSLSSDLLVEVYMRQKNHPEDNSPRVRMIPLNPVGVSFQDLSNPYMIGVMQSLINTPHGEMLQIFPFKTNYTGVRMYTAMWNFRTDLYDFMDQLTPFIEEVSKIDGYNNGDLDRALLKKDLEYRKSINKSSKEEDTILNSITIKDDVYKLLTDKVEEFNKRLSNQGVRRFRLGGGILNLVYIRQLEGFKDKTYGIYGTSKIFRTYKLMVDSIFRHILDQLVIPENKNIRQLIGDNEKYRTGLSGHIKDLFTNGVTNINGETISFRNNSRIDINGIGNIMSHIPSILSKAYALCVLHFSFLEDSSKLDHDHNEIEIYSNKNADLKLVIDWTLILSDIGQESQSIDGKTADLDDMFVVDNFENLFSLIFHGTVDDIHNPDKKYDSAALFPNGLYPDPIVDGNNKVTDSSGKTVFKKCVNQKWYWETDVSIGDPTFYITEKTVLENKPVPKLTTSPKELETLNVKDVLSLSNKVSDNIIDYVQDIILLTLEDNDEAITKNNIEDYLDDLIQNNSSNLSLLASNIGLIKTLSSNDNSDYLVVYNGKLMGASDFIKTIAGNSLMDISSINTKNNTIEITDSLDNKIILLKDLNGNWQREANLNPTSDNTLDNIKNDLKSVLSIIQSEEIDFGLEGTLSDLVKYESLQGKEDSVHEVINNILNNVELNDTLENDLKDRLREYNQQCGK